MYDYFCSSFLKDDYGKMRFYTLYNFSDSLGDIMVIVLHYDDIDNQLLS